MSKERAIDLSLIKSVDLASPGGKGKISLKRLVKEELDKLNVVYADPCCGETIEPIVSITVEDTDTVDLELTGEANKVLTANVKLASVDNNPIMKNRDGIFSCSQNGSYIINIGDEVETSFTLTHNLKSFNLITQVVDNTTNQIFNEATISYPDSITTTITFDEAPLTNQYKVIVYRIARYPYPPIEQLGTIVNDLTSSSWVPDTLANVIFNGDSITFNGGVYVPTISRPENTVFCTGMGTSGIEYWEYVVEFTIDAKVGTTSVMTMGFEGISERDKYVNWGRFVYDGAASGRIQVGVGINNTYLQRGQSTNSLNAVGHRIRLTISMSPTSMTCTSLNLNNSLTRTTTFNWVYDVSFNCYLHNKGRIFLSNAGGNVTINSISFTSTERKNTKFLVIGDSKTKGLYSTTIAQRFSNLLETMSGYSTINYGGRADETKVSELCLPEIIKLNPENVIMFIGRNDVGNEWPMDEIKDRYYNITNTLTCAGIRVFHLLATPEGVVTPLIVTSIDPTELNEFIRSSFPSNRVIDIFTPLVSSDGKYMNPLYFNGDSVHPNILGNQIIADTIYNFIQNVPEL